MPNFTKIVTKIFGSKADKDFKELHPYIEKINDWIQTIVDNNQTKKPSGTELSQAISDIKNKPQSYDARKAIKEVSKNNNSFEIKGNIYGTVYKIIIEKSNFKNKEKIINEINSILNRINAIASNYDENSEILSRASSASSETR